MYSRGYQKTQIGCLVMLAIVILFTSYLATASLNPLVAYTSDNVLAKIIVIVLSVLLGISLIQIIYSNIALYMVRKSIQITTGKSAEDVICPGDGLPLIQFMGSHGLPVRCPNCKKWWHNGPACYNKGMPQPGKIVAFPLYPCPDCRARAANNRNIFDDEGFTSSTW
jgi:hypothetical protein